jgi:hypothetical protein
MSGPRSTDSLCRTALQADAARAGAAVWTALQTWLAAIAAAGVVLAAVFGYSRVDAAHPPTIAPVTTGSAPVSSTQAPLSAPRSAVETPAVPGAGDRED